MQDWNISRKALCLYTLGFSALWGVLLWICVPPQPFMPIYVQWGCLWLAGCVGIAAAVVDWRSHVLPDVFTLYAGIPVVLACAASAAYITHIVQNSLDGGLSPLLGAGLGWALVKGLQVVLRRHKGSEQLGSGDAKLMLPLGALVGPTGLLPLLVLACLLLWPLFRVRKARFLPFGPALVLAAFIVAVTGLRWPL